MKLVIAVVNKSDAPVVADAMSKEGYPSTLLDSRGSFLGEENTMIFSGIDDARVNKVIDIIRLNTSEKIVDVPPEKAFGNFKMPQCIKVSGAVVFILCADQFMRL